MQPVEFDWTVSLKEKLSSIWTSGENSDLTITVSGFKKGFRVHRTILSLFSPVLRQKITGLDPTQKQIHFQQFDTDSMRRFLEYTYTGNFSLSNNDPHLKSAEIFSLFKVAVHFQFIGLADKCSGMLRSGLDKANVFDIYKFAMQNGHKLLIQHCLQFICRNGECVLDNKFEEDLTIDCIFEIVKQDQLCVKNELSVFNAICRWGEAECHRQQLDPKDENQLRTIVQKLLKLVRFPQMSHLEFKNSVLPRKLLNIDETTSLLMFFMAPAEERTKSQFIASPRIYEKRPIGEKTDTESNKEASSKAQNQVVTPTICLNPYAFLFKGPLLLTLKLDWVTGADANVERNRILTTVTVWKTNSVLNLKRKIQELTQYSICYEVLHKGAPLLHDSSNKKVADLGVLYDDIIILSRKMCAAQKQFCCGPSKQHAQFCSLAPFLQYCQQVL